MKFMSKHLLVLLVILLIFISACSPSKQPQSLLSQTLQQTINNAPSGSTVNVPAGTYSESINITKSIILLGQGNDSTIVNSFNISSSNVTIKGFYIVGSGIVTTGSYSDIENNHVYNSPTGGIIVQVGSDNSKIINNKFEHNAHFGIKVNSNNNLIRGNEIWNDRGFGNEW